MILDGRNRYRACVAAAVPVRFVPYKGDDPLAFMVSVNLRRRHMSQDQRALTAAKIANLGEGQPKKNCASWPSSLPASVSQSQAADMMNVSRRSVVRAKAVLKHGVPELADKVAAGTLAVSTAADVARLPPEVQHSTRQRQSLRPRRQMRPKAGV